MNNIVAGHRSRLGAFALRCALRLRLFELGLEQREGFYSSLLPGESLRCFSRLQSYYD